MAVGDPTSCTVDTCPVPDGFLRSPPAAAGSLVLLAAFGVLVPLNLYTGARYRTALFSATLALGILLEVMGYVGRFLLASDVADRRYFVLFLLGTVTGPTIVSAAIYLVLPHIVGLYGKSVRFPWRPVYIGVGFLALDVFTLAFQAVGGAFAANGLSKVETSQGMNMLAAGLGIQILSLLLFFVILYWFLARLTVNRHLVDGQHPYAEVHQSSRFRVFLIFIQVSAGLLLVRTSYRLAQAIQGLHSDLAQSQVVFIVLDGVAVLVASVLLTALPPGRAFGGFWARTSSRQRPERRRPGSLPLAAQRSPYNTYAFSPNQAYTPSPGQTPAHWQEPGYQLPKLGRFSASFGKPPGEKSPSSAHMSFGDVSPPFDKAPRPSPRPLDSTSPRSLAHSAGPLESTSPRSLAYSPPYIASPEPSPSSRKSVVGPVPGRKRLSDRRDVVQQDALWE